MELAIQFRICYKKKNHMQDCKKKKCDGNPIAGSRLMVQVYQRKKSRIDMGRMELRWRSPLGSSLTEWTCGSQPGVKGVWKPWGVELMEPEEALNL